MAPKKQNILVSVAWPYANNELHLGHYAGSLLPPDIFARYHRMAGNNVLMVSGADAHGTPITVKAEAEGVKPAEIVARYQDKFIESFEKMGITFDLFTMTATENHFKLVHEFFKKHLEKGYLYTEVQKQLYDPMAKRFLPDRYVEGTCPHCGFTEARGDQCDNCSKTYEATELKNPKSKVTGSTQLEVRDTEHFFFDLAKVNDPLLEWISEPNKGHWRTSVLNFSRAQLEKRDLHGRAMTRDLDWGVTIPLPGYEGKRIYVWYEAVMGYLSASKEWAQLKGEPDAWKAWWDSQTSPDARGYYFMGKDNITFHTIMWPGYLHAYGGLNLPYDVPANEYLNSYGRKLSKSRGNSIFVLDVLSRYQSDAVRYTLTALAPETADADFTWDDFVERVNGELVANWGNLANRMLGFTAKRFGGIIPAPEGLDDKDKALLAEVREGFTSVANLYEAVKLRSALEEIRSLSQKVNQYLSDKAPWTLIKTDEKAAATAVYVSLQCIDWLKTMWAPILPESSQHIHAMLGYPGSLFGTFKRQRIQDANGEHQVLQYHHEDAVGTWTPGTLKPGQKMGEIVAPFRKLDDDVAAKEAAALTPVNAS